MPIFLENSRKRLIIRLQILDSAFDRHIVAPNYNRSLDKFSLQEGYVSALWQSWCRFCRELLIYSAQGAITHGGTPTSSPYSGRSEMEISYVAKQISLRKSVTCIKSLSASYQEHTWGDVNKALMVAAGIGCTNNNDILQGISGCSRIKDLQVCRNASAHICADTINEVNLAKVRYLDNSFKHPSDMISWIDPATRDFLWKSWVDEMDLASDFAIR